MSESKNTDRKDRHDLNPDKSFPEIPHHTHSKEKEINHPKHPGSSIIEGNDKDICVGSTDVVYTQEMITDPKQKHENL